MNSNEAGTPADGRVRVVESRDPWKGTPVRLFNFLFRFSSMPDDMGPENVLVLVLRGYASEKQRPSTGRSVVLTHWRLARLLRGARRVFEGRKESPF